MELYHVLNHSIEGRDLFIDTQDYARFVHDMYEFNDVSPAGNTIRAFDPDSMFDLVGRTLNQGRRRKKLVDIHGWCLMKNHYHLLVSERSEGGMSRFMMKLNVGYAKYYNEKYSKHGFVFKGRTKKVRVERHRHFLYILHYVHLNPLDYFPRCADWRIRTRGTIRNVSEALTHLENYRWSSYLDYIGEANFPSILTTRFFSSSPKEYRQSLKDYLTESARSSLDVYVLE